MHPAEQRLKNLKELLRLEQGNTLYAQDLKLTIKMVAEQIKNVSSKGYQMVEV